MSSSPSPGQRRRRSGRAPRHGYRSCAGSTGRRRCRRGSAPAWPGWCRPSAAAARCRAAGRPRRTAPSAARTERRPGSPGGYRRSSPARSPPQRGPRRPSVRAASRLRRTGPAIPGSAVRAGTGTDRTRCGTGSPRDRSSAVRRRTAAGSARRRDEPSPHARPATLRAATGPASPSHPQAATRPRTGTGPSARVRSRRPCAAGTPPHRAAGAEGGPRSGSSPAARRLRPPARVRHGTGCVLGGSQRAPCFHVGEAGQERACSARRSTRHRASSRNSPSRTPTPSGPPSGGADRGADR